VSLSALKRKKKDLQEIRSSRIVAVREATDELCSTIQTITQIEREQAGLVAQHEKALEKAGYRDLLERKGSYVLPTEVGLSYFLPKTAIDHVPMLRLFLQRLFPAYPPAKAWSDRALGPILLGGNVRWLRVDSPGLSIDEADLFMALVEASEGRTDSPFETTVWAISERLHRSSNSLNTQKLRDQLKRLSETFLSLNDEHGRMFGPKVAVLTDCATRNIRSQKNTITCSIDSRFAALFASGRKNWTPVNLGMLSRLDGRGKLLRWLALLLSSFGSPHNSKVPDLHLWSGSKQKRESEFRRELLAACKILESDEFGLLALGRSRIEDKHGNFRLFIEKPQSSARFERPLDMPAAGIDACSLWLEGSV